MKDITRWGTKTVLYLLCNPVSTSRLRLDEEVREALESLRYSQYRDLFFIETCWATRIEDMRRALVKLKPQIVIFSGHSNENSEFIFENKVGQARTTSPKDLADLFSLFSDCIECILCNACYSYEQARLFSQYIDYSIGSSKAINDNAAIEFSKSFIDGFACGSNYDFAYELGCSSVKIAGFSHNDLPTLFRRIEMNQGIDLKSIKKNIDLLKNESFSPERERIIIDRTLREIQKIPHHKYSDYWYSDALNETWLYISKNIYKFEFNPSLSPEKSLSNWINSILSIRMKRARAAAIKSRNDEEKIIENTTLPELPDEIIRLISDEDNRAKQEMIALLKDYILKDEEDELKNCASKKCPKCNCRYLLKKRFIDSPSLTWDEIAETISITSKAAQDVLRKCLKRLREKLESMGYKEDS